MNRNRQIHLISRPDGEAMASNFRLVEAPVGEPGEGQVLVRHHYLSLDPYMRGRMNEAKSYAAPQPLGAVMQGGTVGEVVASRHPGYAPGDRVVGQLAKARGCRAVGFAGGADKCAYVTGELGFDACIDYKAHRDAASLQAALDAATPAGVDGCFENVGGPVLDATLARMNAFGRIALCGMISGYDGAPIPLQRPQLILLSRLTVEGFIVSEHMEVWPEALKELGALVASGRLKYRESVAEGIDAAPEAFLGLLKGKNFGKQLVKLV